MNKVLALCLIALASGFVACSPDKKGEQPPLQTAKVQLKTIVCGSCAKTIESAVLKVGGVKSVKVDVESKIATVEFFTSKIDLKSIESTISNAGYDANNTKRNPEAYEKLAACCKIDG